MKVCKLLVYGLCLLMSVAGSLAANSARAATQQEIEQQRTEIRNMAEATLERLYKIQPSAKKAISQSAGYAVFSNYFKDTKLN